MFSVRVQISKSASSALRVAQWRPWRLQMSISNVSKDIPTWKKFEAACSGIKRLLHFKLEKWGSEIWPFKIRKHSKSGLSVDWISNGLVFKGSGYSYSHCYGPNHLKIRPFKIGTFLSWFKKVFVKMVAICLDFKWLGFQISDPIWNPTICNPTSFWPF